MADNEDLIADIMGAQQRLQHLFAYDRSDPLFTSQLTLTQLKILMLLSGHTGTAGLSGRELAGLMGVGLATLSGMIDRLVAHDLVTRQEDAQDRRVRRTTLTPAGAQMIDAIITAGNDKQRRLLNRMTPAELTTVSAALHIMIRAAEADASGDGAPVVDD
jgi:DNA-binding MarR family transcriptional regulator